ncbi:ABC transporter permease [Shewanella sp. YIC-542]|uniref:ABC transporter permease n=1 Tax=Shewanella mytili TaxID=3377111 RepID=UPI00398E66F9
MNPIIYTIARRELLESRRSRWLWLSSLLFALLTLAVTFGSSAVAGQLQLPPLAQLLNSLVSLSCFLLPLIALLLAADAFVSEAESGTMLLMLTYPISKSQWLLGKLLGQGTALLLACLAGYGVLWLLPLWSSAISWQALWQPWLLLLGSGWLLALICLLVGYGISLKVRSRNQALAWVLLLWLLLVLLYDLVLLILAVATDSHMAPEVLQWLQLLNPASAFRLLNQHSSQVPAFLLYLQPWLWLALLWFIVQRQFRLRQL